MHDRVLRRDGLDLMLHVEEGEGPVIFFQHGLCGDALQPRAVFPGGTGVRLAVLECRGHGKSQAGPAESFSIATFADDVAAAIAEVSARPCMIGGISMGAAIALRLACLRPDLVSGLVVARPAWTAEAAPENMRPNLIVGNLLGEPERPGEVEAFRASPTGAMLEANAPDNLASLMGFFHRRPREVTAELLSRLSTDGPGITWAEIARIAVPTLVIGHGDDLIHPFAYATAIAAAVPGARLAEIPPKSRGKDAYEASFRNELRRFVEETNA